jgi:hypothetical protein
MIWLRTDGYKISWRDLENRKGISPFFIREVKSRLKPVMEWIESENIEKKAKQLGVKYAQSFFCDETFFGKIRKNHCINVPDLIV